MSRPATMPTNVNWNSADRGQRAPEYGRNWPEYEDGAVIATKTEARAGVTGHNVRTVLMVSLSAVIVAFALIYALFFA